MRTRRFWTALSEAAEWLADAATLVIFAVGVLWDLRQKGED